MAFCVSSSQECHLTTESVVILKGSFLKAFSQIYGCNTGFVSALIPKSLLE